MLRDLAVGLIGSRVHHGSCSLAAARISIPGGGDQNVFQ